MLPEQQYHMIHLHALPVVVLVIRCDIQARTHLHDHFKQIVRRRHRYGKEHPGIAPSLPSSADHVGVIPAYKMTAYALVPEIKKKEPYLQPDKPDEVDVDDTGGRAGSTGGATRVLTPLATLGMPACDNAAGAREGCGEQDEGDAVTLLDFTGGSQVRRVLAVPLSTRLWKPQSRE